MSSDITKLFRSLFTGYEQSYVKHQPPFVRNGDGKLMAKFAGLAQYKNNSKFHPAPPEGLAEDDYVPVTEQTFKDHLNGKQGLAISPLLDLPPKNGNVRRNMCFFSVIDIDVYDTNYTELVRRLYKVGYKFAPFISKSGGLHLYFFFQNPESADAAVRELKRIVEKFGLHKIYANGSTGASKVEVFPEHVIRKPGVHDKCVFLPFYGSGLPEGSEQLMLTTEGTLLDIVKAIEIMPTMFTSVKEITKTTDELPYSDAPFCIQMLLLSGGLTEGSNRNEFLVTAAIYLKTKDGAAFEKSSLEEMNEDWLGDPIEQKEIDGMFKSVSTKDYQLAGRCSKQPCASVCDKQLCKLREYGVGKSGSKNMVSTVEFGKIYRVLTETPYYMWEARMAGTQEYKMLRIDGAENLLNQKTVQKACIDTLGQVPPTVSAFNWETTLNGCLANIEDLPAPKATDTTEMAALRDLFMRYLTNGQATNKLPHTVRLKQVYYAEGHYYFMTDGLMSYLTVNKFTLGRTNLREQLIGYGCQEGSVKYVTGAGVEKVIPCWVMKEDETLSSLDTFYEDVLEADLGVLSTHKLNKVDKNEQRNATEMDVRF